MFRQRTQAMVIGVMQVTPSRPQFCVAARCVYREPMTSSSNSGIRDNYSRGTAGDFLKEKIKANSSLSVVSAYFTIYAYEALKEQLDSKEMKMN